MEILPDGPSWNRFTPPAGGIIKTYMCKNLIFKQWVAYRNEISVVMLEENRIYRHACRLLPQSANLNLPWEVMPIRGARVQIQCNIGPLSGE